MQERRFVEQMRRNVRGRHLCFADCEFGPEAARVVAALVRCKDAFATLDLRKNNLGNEGVKHLCGGLVANTSLVHIDVGNNDIGPEGSTMLFETLARSSSGGGGSVVSLDFSNKEARHRNRAGP